MNIIIIKSGSNKLSARSLRSLCQHAKVDFCFFEIIYLFIFRFSCGFLLVNFVSYCIERAIFARLWWYSFCCFGSWAQPTAKMLILSSHIFFFHIIFILHAYNVSICSFLLIRKTQTDDVQWWFKIWRLTSDFCSLSWSLAISPQ